MLHLCPICNKTKDGKMNELVFDPILKKQVHKHKWKLNKRPCKTCKEVMKEAVTLSCSGCDSITMVNEEVFTKR